MNSAVVIHSVWSVCMTMSVWSCSWPRNFIFGTSVHLQNI